VPEAETHPLLRPPDVDSLPEPSVPNPLAVPKAHHDLQNLCPTCRYHPSYIYSHLHLEKTLDDELAYYERCGDKEMYEDTLSNDPVAQTRLKAFSHSLGIASNCMPAGSTFAQTAFHSLNYSAAKASRFMRIKYQADLKKSGVRIMWRGKGLEE